MAHWWEPTLGDLVLFTSLSLPQFPQLEHADINSAFLVQLLPGVNEKLADGTLSTVPALE